MEIQQHHRQLHALVFPFPAQGHVNPMMQLAHKLLSSGFFITFLNTDFNHQQMFDGAASQYLLHLPNLRFEHLPDGLPPSHGRFNQSVPECTAAICALAEPIAKLVEKIMRGPWPPLTCIVADCLCSWMQNVADKFDVPRVALWTTPVHANIVYNSQSRLISQGYIPLKDKDRASEIMTGIAGVAPMALSEYPFLYLGDDVNSDYMFQWLLNDCMKRPNEAAWNLGNNLAELEAEGIQAFQKEIKSFVAIGPLLPEAVLKEEEWKGGAGLSIRAEEGETCGAWLASQGEKSVLYISGGSVASMGENAVEEMVKGVEESGVPFLWVVRADQGGEALKELRRRLEEGGKSMKGKMVGWAPQLEVLAHKAVGGFISHCGWNSVVESICAGVPILAAAGNFGEQRMNAHYVTNVWRIGLPLPPASSGDFITTQIRTLFAESPQAIELRCRLMAIRKAALASLSPPSGVSISNFQLFVEDMQRRSASSEHTSIASNSFHRTKSNAEMHGF